MESPYMYPKLRIKLYVAEEEATKLSGSGAHDCRQEDGHDHARRANELVPDKDHCECFSVKHPEEAEGKGRKRESGEHELAKREGEKNRAGPEGRGAFRGLEVDRQEVGKCLMEHERSE
jgi:hypothetical protein